ncbi:RluA family pseudouridine synthase [Lactobacillus sp. PV012]|uniref:RluA family pseudouridine synthase n=1 Tax=Lactobacillus sp. PV012 TaxID=2594494 RepID=UPI00223F8F33|nr:RluA family pseudouridine synthase [Lactobacillus sp. PV012]QNQ81952.1 RluA family pseudouridine synthase [Lactobacillus sp. PV012]
MTEYEFSLTYPLTFTPLSVDKVMRKLLIPRKWRHFLRSENKILINDKYLPLNFLVKPGDRIKILLDHVESLQHPYPPSGHLPDIIYEDKNILVINKPAGQKTHPNQGENNTALNDCSTYLGYSPYIVHRLDMLTHGLLLVAKNPAVVPILNRQLIDKTLNRQYLAKVAPDFSLPSKGTINAPIGQDPSDQRKRITLSTGLPATTHYQVLKQTTEYTLLKLQLETGRTHQIRVHLQSIGYPILGDPLYNQHYSAGQALALTAYQLSLNLPFSFKKKTISLFEAKK